MPTSPGLVLNYGYLGLRVVTMGYGDWMDWADLRTTVNTLYDIHVGALEVYSIEVSATTPYDVRIEVE